MKATDFEYRHQTLLHILIVGAALFTYLIERDDTVWRFVKNSAAPHALERSIFLVATLFITGGAAMCTWVRARHRANTTRYVADFVYSIGLGSLVPLSGFVILVAGEAVRLLRLIRREQDPAAAPSQNPACERTSVPREDASDWKHALRCEAVKWGIFVTMIVFVITLRDSYADVLVLASFVIGNLLNLRFSRPSPRAAEPPECL
jgi:hypothetical protein